MTKTVIAYLLFSFCLFLLCGLGVWQLFRRDIKENLIDKITRNLNGDPVILSENISQAQEYLAVRVHGKFLSGKNIYIYDSRIREGKTGFTLLSAFQLVDNRIVLVDRGFYS